MKAPGVTTIINGKNKTLYMQVSDLLISFYLQVKFKPALVENAQSFRCKIITILIRRGFKILLLPISEAD